MFGLDAFPCTDTVCLYRILPHYFPGNHYRPASYLAVLEGLWLKTKIRSGDRCTTSGRIFAVNFGMGVVSGLVMAYQFGTNWSGFSQLRAALPVRF